jgi:hypothetical protein
LVDRAVGPDEWYRVLGVAGDEVVDTNHKFRDAAERRSRQRFSGQDVEPDFDLADFRCLSRCVMELHVRMPGPPTIPLLFVGGGLSRMVTIASPWYSFTVRFMTGAGTGAGPFPSLWIRRLAAGGTANH